MAQNIYDDAAFYAGYSQFPRSREGLAGAPEWPDLKAMLPDVSQRRVLDLGCGFGAFCRWAAENGAAEVLGVDLSSRMLDEAKSRGMPQGLRYEQENLETYVPPAASFELVYSSLAVHYLADFDAFCAKVRAALTDDGRFVFSMEHPIFAARAKADWGTDSDGARTWAIRDYAVEGERVTDWIVDGIVKYHRTVATTLSTLQRHGLMLDAIDEWAPSAHDIAANPGLADELVRPMLLLVATRVAPTTIS